MIIFTIETIVKILTYGLIFNGEYSYFKGGWNILDFIVLVFSYLCLTELEDNFKMVKAFRVLRSLRLITRNEGLKVAVRSLIFAIPNILNISAIMILFFLIYAVISVSFFKGKMDYCNY